MTDKKPGLCPARNRAGDECLRSAGHPGLHRAQNDVSWMPGTCGTPHPDKRVVCTLPVSHPGRHLEASTGTWSPAWNDPESGLCGTPHPDKAVACALPVAHPGAHLDPDDRGRWTAMWTSPDTEPESDAPSWPPKEWTVPQTIRGEIVQAPQEPVSGPCGVRLYLPTGRTSCVLRSGHEGLHGAENGGPFEGRLVEEVLAEAYQRISRLESMLDRERGIHDRYRTQTQQTYERQIRLQSTFQDHVTDELRKLAQRLDNAAFRLSGLETRVQSVDLGSASAVQDIERRMETITNHLGKQAPAPLTDALVPASEVTESLRLMTRALDEVRDRLPAKECGVTDGSDPDKDAYVCSLTPGHGGGHCDEPNGHTWWRRESGLSFDLD